MSSTRAALIRTHAVSPLLSAMSMGKSVGLRRFGACAAVLRAC